MSWSPLIEDEAERARMLAVADEIAVAMAALPPTHDTDALVDHAILRAYLGCDDDADADRDIGGESLAAAIRRLGTGAPLGPGLHGGAARIGWAAAHLAAGEDAEMVAGSVQRSILAVLERPDFHDYDVVSGVVGIGVFALERGEPGRELAVAVLERLERDARPQREGLTWFTSPDTLIGWQREMAPQGYWNLGLAHGSPGAIALLARYVTEGVEPARARALLDGAVAHLLSTAVADRGGRFPAWIIEGSTAAPEPARRVAWCYGDLGVAVALLAAAGAAGDDRWRAEALATAHAAARCSVADSSVVDGGLCHGAAGAAHLFHRMHRATGDLELRDAARRWLAHALAIRNDEPIAGFPSAQFDGDRMSWSPERFLLTGAPGVALVLHAACTELEPAWDRLLLC